MNDEQQSKESKLLVDEAEVNKYYCAYCHQAYNTNAGSLLCASCRKLLNARVALEKLETKCEVSTGCTHQYVFSKLKEGGSLSLKKDRLSSKKDGDLSLKQNSGLSLTKGDHRLKKDSLSLKKDGDLSLEQNSSLSLKKDGDHLLKKDKGFSLKKDGGLSCVKCQRTFINHRSMMKHVAICGVKNFPCNNCGMTFRDMVKLKSHQSLCICSTPTSTHAPGSSKVKGAETSLSLKKDGDHLLKKDKGFSLKKDGGLSCVKCQRTFINRRSMMKHVAICGVKTFPCNTCGMTFRDMVKLKSHELLCICSTPTTTHAPGSSKAKGAETLSCVYCEKSFNVRITLYKHERKCKLISEAAQVFEKDGKSEASHFAVDNPCKPCSSKREDAKVLSSEHRQKTSNLGRTREQLSFTCCSCKKMFKNKRSIVKHVAICGVKEFRCDICGEVFRKIRKLKTHEATHTFSADNPHEPCFSEMKHIKTFSCVYCEKNFNAQITLFKHEKQCLLNTDDGKKPHVKQNAVVVYLGTVHINGNDQHIWGQFIWER